jgi:predicted ATPase
VDAVHERSDGIPLHVEELLAAIRSGPDRSGEDVGRAAVPGSLAEAVLGRLGPMREDVKLTVWTAAVIGRSFDLDLLAACVETSMDQLGEPVDWLHERFVIVPTPDGQGYDFRHALIRDALYEDIPLPTRRVLHGRVADAIARHGGSPDDAALSMHYERAGRRDEASTHALRAAQRAAGMSAHREALELYRRALANLPPDTPPEDRAAILAAFADEATATDRNEDAASAFS